MVLVTCPLCGQQLQSLDRDHAKAHGHTSLAEFIDAYAIEYKTALQRSRMRFRQLYNIDVRRWAVVYFTESGNWRYVTKSYSDDYERDRHLTGAASKFPLADSDFNRHFNGRNPLAIFAHGTHARYFGFDVDSKDDAPEHTLRIVKTLVSEGIPRPDVHVSFSGGKGYHVELFVDKHVKLEHWSAFGAYIIDKSGLTGAPIEFRPTKTNGHAWKLPLTFHHKTGSFAGYCDNETLEVYGEQDSHDYLFLIRPFEGAILYPILRRARQAVSGIERRRKEEAQEKRKTEDAGRKAVKITEPLLFQSPDEKKTSAIRYLTEGLVTPGTRHNITVLLACYLWHECGNTVEEIEQILTEWTERQIERGLVGSTAEEYTDDIRRISAWAQTTPAFYSIIKEISITRAEVEWVLTVPNRVARDVLWAILLRAKVYAKADGSFYTSDRDLQKVLSKPRLINRTTVSKWRRWLSEHEYIVATVPDQKTAYHLRIATSYRLQFQPPENAEVIDTVTFEDGMDGRELLRAVAGKLYSAQEMRKFKLV